MNQRMLALLTLLLQTTALTTAPPPLPYYERHVTCWCEKCDGFDEAGRWTAAREVGAYGKSGVASTRLFSVAAGEKVKVLDGVVVVDRAERVRVVKPMQLLGENAPLSLKIRSAGCAPTGTSSTTAAAPRPRPVYR
jgi:hypothetical protein